MTPPERLYCIDWIRILAFLLLILFHATLPFTVFPWELKDSNPSPSLSSIIWWLHQWRLPLLFFISGAGVTLSLRSRSIAAFAGERSVRLFVPLIFAMFFTIPAQVYIEFLQKGKFRGTYAEFYPSVWKMVPYPEGSLTWSHLWFLVYLIAFILLLLPVFALFKIPRMQKIRDKISGQLSLPLPSALLFLPLWAIFHAWYLRYPETGGLIGDWFVFLFSLTLFFLGYLLGGSMSFWDACARNRRRYGLLALTTTVILFIFYWWPLQLPVANGRAYDAYALLNSSCIWFTILTLCGYARQYLHRNSPARTYLTEAVFPLYVIHQTIIVTLGYGIVRINASWPCKLTLLITLSFCLMILIYHFVIRKTVLTRFLFGMKLRSTKR